ncbi:alternative ribosome rescue aminoacyl-tRNA hydrolase ArfB [Emcibacter nanhaiensis]|uniref:Aminoacyl-tRNA hydrolase n=1 Tax=Emcibacter nanhaiensis TaxID=1505037 RepID=A0A501PNC6_9PROT|nr:alternative ribosome rescue aminoacyl-tRNA hydrolase ArfB [Emcibacter nanhaiensis]TPD61795.1 aminoacyl-tRNA hydrolase [Emcibacter nanhaiensis]
MIEITHNIHIDEDEIEEQFIRSPGPGGQNVNKVSTGVQLRYDAKHSAAISPALFARLRTLAGQRMTKDGVLVISVHETRSQARNRELALERLVELIRQATHVPKKRTPTKPSRGARERRLEGKKKQGALKKTRAKVNLNQ